MSARAMRQCVRNRTITVWAILLVLAVGRLTAQNATGTLVGHVKDPNGAAVAAAQVSVTNMDTRDVRTTSTNDTGDYTVPVLRPGRYRLNVTAKGFKGESEGGIALNVDQTIRIETALTIGTAAESVIVDAAAVALDTDSSSVGDLIGGEQVSELPLNGRNFQDLMFLSSGAVNDGGGDVAGYRLSVSGTGVSNVSVGGSRGASNGWTLDGTSIFDTGYGSVMFPLSLDDLAEYDLLSKSYSAAYGYSMNQVNLTSKSGTNSFHGSAFEYLRNTAVDAYKHGVTTLPLLQQNQFGYSLGGPVRIPWLYDGRNKTFFFANYEGFRQNIAGAGTTTIPEAGELSGTFSAAVLGKFTAAQTTNGAYTQCGHTYHVGDPHPLFNPWDPSGQACPFPVNADGSYAIPSQYISKIGALIMRPGLYYPKAGPNISGVALGAPNYSYNSSTHLTYDQQNYRFDQNIGSKDQLFFHLVWHNEAQNGNSYSPVNADFTSQPARYYSATETHTFSANFTNQIRLGYADLKWANGPDAAISASDLSSLNWPSPFTSPGEGYPRITFDTSALNDGLTYGGNESLYGGTSARTSGVWDFGESAIWTIKRHTLSFGFGTRLLNYDMYAGGSLGQLLFNGQYSGDTLADALLGAASSLSITELGPLSNPATGNDAHVHFNSWAPYLQDDWKVTDKLTLNLGLRYEYESIPYEEQNHFIWPDFNAPGGALYNADAKAAAAYGGVNPFAPSTGLYVPSPGGERGPGPAEKDVFAPRLGFAYRVFGSDKTVVRGGFGRYFDTIEADEYQASSVNNFPASGGFSSGPDAAWSLSPKFNTNSMPASSPAGVLVSNTSPTGSNLGFIQIQAAKKLNPQLLAWTLGVEHELPWQTKLDVEYVANHGANLYSRYNPNGPVQCIAINGCTATNSGSSVPIADRVPYPNLGTLVYAGFVGFSNYNALDVKLEHRTRDLNLVVAYTWSKALDIKSAVAGLNGDDAGWAGPQDNYDIGADYSRSDYDDRQRLAISAVYPLPVGRGRAVLGNSPRAVDEAIGGWTFSVNTSFQGGLPFTIAAADPSNANNSYSRRANINRTQASFHKSNAQWFSSDNTTGATDATFTQPLDGYYGTSPRNAVSAPGEINGDASLSKRFAITENTGFELKFDAFNALNHWNPGYPNSDINGALPGYIAPNDSANSARELQISGRFTF